MKAQELMTSSLALMGETAESGSEYQGYCMPIINILLAETFIYNNAVRVYKGKEPIKELVQIKTLADDLLYEDDFIITCLTYGLAAKLILEDNDTARFNYFMQVYSQAIENANKAAFVAIEDVYGGDSY